MHILVIDDDALAGEMTAAILDQLGHATLLVENADAACATLAQRSDIWLLVCDLHMPDTSGIELFRHLRTHACTLPFILLSGDNPARALREEARIDACLLKDEHLERSLHAALAALSACARLEPAEDQP